MEQPKIPQPTTEEAIAAIEGVLAALWTNGKIDIVPPAQFQLLSIAWDALKKAVIASTPADVVAVVPPDE